MRHLILSDLYRKAPGLLPPRVLLGAPWPLLSYSYAQGCSVTSLLPPHPACPPPAQALQQVCELEARLCIVLMWGSDPQPTQGPCVPCLL